MDLISLFTGGGGMDLGFHRAGYKTIFANDTSNAARVAWKVNFRTPVFHHGDIRDMTTFPAARVVIGGFPCQDFSNAGKRKGFGTDRGQLYKEFFRVVNSVKPDIFVAENVTGLLSMDGGNIITQAAGPDYNVVYDVLYAPDYGVPQTRKRVFFVGTRQDRDVYQFPLKTHFLGTYNLVSNVLGDLPHPAKSDDPSHMAYSKAKWRKSGQGQNVIPWDGLAPTIRAEHHGNIEFVNSERRLSVRECARLQTFPDDFAFVFPGVSMSNGYKLVGNAVPPLLAEAIACNI